MDKLIAGNWKKFDSFAWFEQPEDAESWALWYTSNRDSGLMTKANEAVIKKEMSGFKRYDEDTGKGDVREEHHTHWAAGYIDGYAIRMLDSKGRPTQAGEKANELIHRMDGYPILDEDGYYRLVEEAIDKLSAFDLKCIAESNKIKTRAETRDGLVKAIPHEYLQEYVES